MLNNLNPLLRKDNWCRLCIHLTDLNLNNCKVVEAMGLKVVASRALPTASFPYKISSKSIKRFKSH
jgi:hypothetical protein